jgi:hypothetical protein
VGASNHITKRGTFSHGAALAGTEPMPMTYSENQWIARVMRMINDLTAREPSTITGMVQPSAAENVLSAARNLIQTVNQETRDLAA